MSQPNIPKTYISRYGQETELPSIPPKNDLAWNGDFDSGYGSEDWDSFEAGDWEGNIEEPISGENRPEDDQLLSELSGEFPQVEEDSFLQETLQKDLETLSNEIASDPVFIEDPALRESLQEKLQTLSGLLSQSGSWDQLEEGLGELRAEYETKKEELLVSWNQKYGSIQELVNYLNEQGVTDLSVERVVGSIEEEGLELSDLKNLVLPANSETYKKLFNVLKNVDPDLQKMLEEHADNPLRPEIQDRLSQGLATLLPRVGNVENADLENMIIASVPLAWPSPSDVRAQFGADQGGNSIDNNSLNNEAAAIDDVMNQALRSGDFASDGVLHDRLFNTDGDGMNWDRGNKGNAFRRWLGALYAAVGKDKTLLKAMLRQHLPENVLMEMYAIFQPGGHHLQLTGDHLTTTDIVNLFEEIFAAPPLN